MEAGFAFGLASICHSFCEFVLPHHISLRNNSYMKMVKIDCYIKSVIHNVVPEFLNVP